jgi:hypothetical protein
MQLQYPTSVSWGLAVWLPIRLDYLGEAAFMFSFLFAMIIAAVSVMKGKNQQIDHVHVINQDET